MKTKIKQAIQAAINEKYCISPLEIIVWDEEKLSKYDRKLISRKIIRKVGSYLK